MASFEMQWRGGDSASDFGPDDSVFPFFNSSPNRFDGRPRLLASDQRPSGSISEPQLFPISEYPAPVGIASLGDYAFLTNGGFVEPAAIPRPRSMVDDVDYNINYFNSYPDRSATMVNDAGSGSGVGYSYGLVPAPPLLAASGAPSSSFLHPPQSSCLDSQSPSPIHTVVTSRLEPLDMVPTIPPAADTRHVFFSPDGGIYDMASSAHGVYHLQQGLEQAQEPLVSASGGIQPSFSFTLPGMPNAEEAFLSQFQEPVANISPAGVGEALTGEQQQGVQYPSISGDQPTFDALPGPDIFGTDQQDLAPRGESPSTSDSSKSSQKRARDQVEPSTSTPVKRQRVNRSSDNYVQRSTRKKKDCDFDLVFGSDDEDENDSGNDDSDAYIPSRSPSPVLPSFVVTSPSPSASPPVTDELSTTVVKGKRGRGRGKGKAKGSAARALAIITRVREEQDSLKSMEFVFPDLSDGDSLSIGGASSEGRTRRAPLPVPVPNLIKKSRGRKVPYLPVLRGGEGIGEGVPVTGIATLSPSGRRGRRKTAASNLDDEAPAVDARTFVCMVPGCGKCFVRGEHLKRHVRSIHTDDKPHVCPYKGCGKSFSRRDNLGQHVRIHLEE